MAHVSCTVRIDFTPGAVPGHLSASVQYVTPGGEVFATVGPADVAAGKSLSLGTVELTVNTAVTAGPTPPPPPTLNATGGATGPAAR